MAAVSPILPAGAEPATRTPAAARRHGRSVRRRSRRPKPGRRPAGEQKTITIIDGSSGAHQDVVIAAGDGAGQGRAADAAPAMMAGIDPQLLEKSRYGTIPVVADGLKPFTRLCRRGRPRQGGQDAGASRIVVGGLGVGAAKTADAIMKLPAAVTLAFTPYGSDPAQAGRAGARRSVTRCCCRCRWSRSIIPTTIPGRRRC